MKNIKTLDEFVNEEWSFKKFRRDQLLKKYPHILLLELIKEKVSKMDPDMITKDQYDFIFTIKGGIEPREEDPHGEEVWEEDIEVKCSWGRVTVNGDKLMISEKEAKKLYYYINNRKERAEEIRKNARIDKIYKKLKDSFLNERNIFKKVDLQYSQLIDKLYNYLLNADLDSISVNRSVNVPAVAKPRLHGNYYGFVIQNEEENNPPRTNDPYEEENWEVEQEEDVFIWLSKSNHSREFGYEYYLYLNKDKVDVPNYMVRKLYKLIENRFKNREKDELERRLKDKIRGLPL